MNHVSCSDVWSLGCVLYELCTLHHPVCFLSTLTLTVDVALSENHVAFFFFFWHLLMMCPVSGTELEEPDFKDMPGCVPSPPWASAVRASVFAQTDVQDKPKRQTFRAYHPDLSPGCQALACTSASAGKAVQSSPGHVTNLSHFHRLLSCVDGQSRTETGSAVIAANKKKICFFS